MEVIVNAARLDNDYLFIGMVRHISKRKKAETALLDMRNRLDLAMRSSNLGLWDTNLKTGKATYDERWAQMLGYEPEDIEHTVEFFDSLRHPEDVHKAKDYWMQHVKGEKPY